VSPCTAVVVSAAIQNALIIAGKDIAEVRLVCTGAGAAAIACLDLVGRCRFTVTKPMLNAPMVSVLETIIS